MTPMVPLVLFGWVPVVLWLFASLPARRAMLVSFLAAWMFLPEGVSYHISGIPPYTRSSATSVGVLLGTALFAPGKWRSVRPKMLDVPMLVWCLCPLASSITNSLGIYDGLSGVAAHVIDWGLPYLIGRISLTDLEGMKEAAYLLFAAGLVYVPLCLWEVRMSPNLNYFVYGYGESGIEYVSDLGKWGSRPRVFMGTALTLGVFMTSASLAGAWLWTTGSLKRIWGKSVGSAVLILLLTTLLCKNMGALSLLAMGLAALYAIKRLHTPACIYALILAAPVYMTARSTGAWTGQSMTELAGTVHQKRADSLQTRLTNEDRLVDKALQQPLFGWGTWGRNRVYNEDGEDITITDGLWVMALGTKGIVGLVSLTLAILLPPAALLWRYPARLWVHPIMAPAGALAVCTVLYMVDCLFNAMLNPLFVVVAGGLVSLAAGQSERSYEREAKLNGSAAWSAT
jgi:hypothetical protein